jgi:hypothetical protein
MSRRVETGYEWLSERTANAITQLTSIDVGPDAVILDDDRFFRPIQRTLSQDVVQCLLSALDHLRALVRGLQSRDKPYPYAQATLIRTAMPGAATALWMASGRTPTERRCRAMEFMFNDLNSQLSWMTTRASEPMISSGQRQTCWHSTPCGKRRTDELIGLSKRPLRC